MLKVQLSQYQKEEQEVKDEIKALRQKVLSQGSKAKSFIRIGMTYDEISNELGEGKGIYKSLNSRADISLGLSYGDSWGSSKFYAIGDIWFHFDRSGLVDGVWPHDKMQLIIDASSRENRMYLMKKYNIAEKLY